MVKFILLQFNYRKQRIPTRTVLTMLKHIKQVQRKKTQASEKTAYTQSVNVLHNN